MARTDFFWHGDACLAFSQARQSLRARAPPTKVHEAADMNIMLSTKASEKLQVASEINHNRKYIFYLDINNTL